MEVCLRFISLQRRKRIFGSIVDAVLSFHVGRLGAS